MGLPDHFLSNKKLISGALIVLLLLMGVMYLGDQASAPILFVENAQPDSNSRDSLIEERIDDQQVVPDHEYLSDSKNTKELSMPSVTPENEIDNGYHKTLLSETNDIEKDSLIYEGSNSYESETIVTLRAVCPSCTDLLLHIRLMTGNRFSDDDLINIMKTASPDPETDPELVAIYLSRMALKSISPDDYEALKHYEQNALGYLIEPDSLSSVVATDGFQQYKAYLIETEVIEDFCKKNHRSLTCIERRENT